MPVHIKLAGGRGVLVVSNHTHPTETRSLREARARTERSRMTEQEEWAEWFNTISYRAFKAASILDVIALMRVAFAAGFNAGSGQTDA